MSDVKTHWSFWVICVIALIWNILGSINFMMQMNPDMVASFPAEAQSLIASRPLWSTMAFAVAVFGGALAVILLLLKNAISYYLFVASFLGVIITNIHTFQVTNSTDIWVGSIMSFVVAACLILYSKFTERKGWIN